MYPSSYFTPAGARKDVFFVLWRGFAQSEGTCSHNRQCGSAREEEEE
jgi:hypothetical protein